MIWVPQSSFLFLPVLAVLLVGVVLLVAALENRDG